MSAEKAVQKPSGGAPAKKPGLSTGQWIGAVVGVLIMFGTGFVVPAWSAVTPMGVSMIGVFIGLLVLITATNNLIWTSLLAIFAIVVLGYSAGNATISSSLGNSTVFQCILLFMICFGMRKTGVGEVLAKKVVSAKFMQGRPFVFTWVLLAVFMLADTLLGATAGTLLAYTIFDSIKDVLGFQKKDRYVQAMKMGLYLCGIMGAALMPFQAMPLAITGAFTAAIAPYGFGFNAGLYIVGSLIVGMVFVFAYALLIKFVFGCDMSRLQSFDPNEIEALKKIDSHFSAGQIIYVLAFLVGIAYSFVTLFISKDTAFYAWFGPISQGVWFVVTIVAVSLIHIEGKPLLDTRAAMKEGVDWGIILAVAAFVVIGGALSNQDLGIQAWLTELLSPIFANMPFPVFMLIIIAVTTIITNFFSNMATGIIVSSVAMPFIAAYCGAGADATMIAAAISVSANCAFLTYAAAGPAPIMLGNEDMESKFVWSRGAITIVAYVIVATVVFSVLAMVL